MSAGCRKPIAAGRRRKKNLTPRGIDIARGHLSNLEYYILASNVKSLLSVCYEMMPRVSAIFSADDFSVHDLPANYYEATSSAAHRSRRKGRRQSPRWRYKAEIKSRAIVMAFLHSSTIRWPAPFKIAQRPSPWRPFFTSRAWNRVIIRLADCITPAAAASAARIGRSMTCVSPHSASPGFWRRWIGHFRRKFHSRTHFSTSHQDFSSAPISSLNTKCRKHDCFFSSIFPHEAFISHFGDLLL